MPSTQKALLLEKKFGDFLIKETEIYKPGPGEILIKIQATSLNPVDWKIQKYGIFVEEFPAVIGCDIAGDVEELGEGVIGFKKGDRVFVQGQFNYSRFSSFQQYCVAIAATVAKLPDNWSYEQVSALPGVLTCAYVALYNKSPFGLGFEPPVSEATKGKYAGTPIVILGGASSVGQIAIQLAKLSGFSPILTTASLKHTEHLKSIGATEVFDRNLPSSALITAIKKATGSQPVKHVFDTVSSAKTEQDGLDILASGGQIILVLPLAVPAPEDKKVTTVSGFLRDPNNVELLESLYRDHITAWLEQGVIKPNSIEILPRGLAGIPEGLARLQKDQVSGFKLVAHPQET
ncbi:Dehydrogenase orsE [Psilocybe cubensis]|uniref:Enoyl reductase (ER) domain-containing protein n=2 Tax=Psilocybe cubensis TaxID=181762 RepID=A0A8H7Y1S4_PSICU|nr:Dehydrogenase orsE [Psilocybe cubensis]KAH9481157.1 Dehydrogenase orsE [Psilocybe cubensis]